MNDKKLILITNDDGYQAQGIGVLTEIMREFGDVVMVAPDGPRSGAACAITPILPVKLTLISEEPGLKVMACSGTPVDCVKLALEKVCQRQPDLVVSGINHGDNASVSVHYSGTMGAVFEGCMKRLPAIGFSLRTSKQNCNFSPYLDAIRKVTATVLEKGLPAGTCLNVNFPEVEHLQGIKTCRMAWGEWTSEWEDARHPRGGNYYWLTGHFTNLEPDAPDTDYHVLDQGFASVTPIHMDMTDYDFLKELSL